MTSYWLTIGTVTWVYLGETMPARALGIAISFKWFINCILKLLPWISLHIQGHPYDSSKYDEAISSYFFLFSGFLIAGFFTCLVFVYETKSLTPRTLAKLYLNKYHDIMKGEEDLMVSMQSNTNSFIAKD